jgi:hypothetical protein
MTGRIIRSHFGSKPTAGISDITVVPQKILNETHEQSEAGSTHTIQEGSVGESAIAR